MAGFVVDANIGGEPEKSLMDYASVGNSSEAMTACRRIQQDSDVVVVNRAPVLTLWGAIVSHREGQCREPPVTWEEALTYGKAVANLCARTKGTKLGLMEANRNNQSEPYQQSLKKHKSNFGAVKVFGTSLEVSTVNGRLYGVEDGHPVSPSRVLSYLENSFGANLPRVKQALEAVAVQFPPEDLSAQAFRLYENFRPVVAPGRGGWGQKGVLNLQYVRALAEDLAFANECDWDT